MWIILRVITTGWIVIDRGMILVPRYVEYPYTLEWIADERIAAALVQGQGRRLHARARKSECPLENAYRSPSVRKGRYDRTAQNNKQTTQHTHENTHKQ